MATITNSSLSEQALTASEPIHSLEQNIDMVLVLSSELVCQIAEKYFNQTMLKKKVKVIDLQPTSNGLVQFNVAFVVEATVTPTTMPLITTELIGVVQPRESNGKFKRAKPQV